MNRKIGGPLILLMMVTIFVLGILYGSFLCGRNTIDSRLIYIFAGAIIPILTKFIDRGIFKPNLIIDFDLAPPFCSKTPLAFHYERKKDIMRKIDTQAYFFRIGIYNTGFFQAKACEVFISELKIFIPESKEWENVENFQQVKLKWIPAESNDTYKNIPRMPIKLMCDIGFIIKDYLEEFSVDVNSINLNVKPNVFQLNYQYVIGGYQPRYLEANKEYRFTITVVSENANSKSQTFELFWTGIWKENPKEMLDTKIINIKKIKN